LIRRAITERKLLSRGCVQRDQDVCHVYRQQHGHPGAVQAHLRTVRRHVPSQGFPSLVHGRGHGRDGVHRGRVEHERPHLRVPAVPGRHDRGRLRRRRRTGRRNVERSLEPLLNLSIFLVKVFFTCTFCYLLNAVCCNTAQVVLYLTIMVYKSVASRK